MQFNEKGRILTMMTDKVTSGGWRGYIYLVLQPFPSEMYSNVNVIEFCIPLDLYYPIQVRNVIKLFRPLC